MFDGLGEEVFLEQRYEDGIIHMCVCVCVFCDVIDSMELNRPHSNLANNLINHLNKQYIN